MLNNKGNKFQPLAVVTGASSGIGYELSKQFAKNGFDLAVVAEDQGIVEAAQIFRGFGGEVYSFQINLATYAGVEQFFCEVQNLDRNIDAAALNAGVGLGGTSFLKSDLKDELNLIALNVNSTIHLSKRILREMAKQGQGRLLFTSSIAAHSPGPYESVYAASKAFVQSFAEAVRVEVKELGISVTCLMPGPTETNFFHRAGMDDTRIGRSKKDDPSDVALQGYEALMSGKDQIVAGSLINRVQNATSKILPDEVSAKLHSRFSEPISPVYKR